METTVACSPHQSSCCRSRLEMWDRKGGRMCVQRGGGGGVDEGEIQEPLLVT